MSEARIYRFPDGEDITPEPSPDETVFKAADHYWEKLRYHEGKTNVYRKLLGLKAIERAVKGDET